MRASGQKITYVGSVAEADNDYGDRTLSLSSLNLQENDFVIAFSASAAGATRQPVLTTSGYTLLADLEVVDFRSSSLFVYYKKMGASPDENITFNRAFETTTYKSYGVYVLRGVHTSSPFSATTTTATSISSGIPNPPSISPTAEGSKVVAIGAAAVSTGAAIDVSALTDGITVFKETEITSVVGIGHLTFAGAVIDPPAMTGPDDVGYSWCAASIALRPA